MNRSVFLKTLKYDAMFYFLFFGWIWIMFYAIVKKTVSFAGGMSTEQLQVYLLSDPVFAQAVLSEMKTLLWLIIIFIVVMIAGGFFLYAYTRKKIWAVITHRDIRFGTWIKASLFMTVSAIIIFMLGLLVSILVSNIWHPLGNLVMLICMVLMMVISFGLYENLYSRVFIAASKTFERKKEIFIKLGYGAGVFVIFQIILIPLAAFLYEHFLVNFLVHTLFIVVFTTWLRLSRLNVRNK